MLVADAEIVAEDARATTNNSANSGIAAQRVSNDSATGCASKPALGVVVEAGGKPNHGDNGDNPGFLEHDKLPSLKRNCFAGTVSLVTQAGAKAFFTLWPQSADPKITFGRAIKLPEKG